jgi:type I restriction enzyme, S subunit
MAGINVTKLKEVSVYVPSLDVQKKFVSKLNLLEIQKEYFLSSILKTQNLFNSLIQKAFNGELVA